MVGNKVSMRTILLNILLGLITLGCTNHEKTEEKTSYCQLTPLPLGNVTAQGWLKTQLERNKAGMGGHLDALEPEMIAKPYVDRNHKSQVSPGWSGEISGTYWTGLVQLAFILNDEELKAKAHKWVYATIALQEEDGYLGNYRPTDNRLEDYCAWSANWCYRALLHWYEATGDKSVLNAVHKGLLWFVKNWAGDQKTSYAGPTLIESMVVVYLKTGDKRLYNWCLDYIIWLDNNDKYHHSKASLQRESLEFNEDHVVAFGENVKNPALIYLAGGDIEYLEATQNGIKNIMEKCWQVNGAPASNFEYLSPPSAVHVTEYCNFATYLNTFSWMALITGEAQYGDLMERILFNAAQGARKKDERAIAYMSSPNQLCATMESCRFGPSNSMEVYSPCYQVACCPAQSVRIVPEYIRAMFLKDKDENLFLPIYGPGKLSFFSNSGIKISIIEETDYPFDENITLKINTSAPWEKQIMLKIPSWCKKYKVDLNGQIINSVIDYNGYIPIKNTWNDDTLKIFFHMKPTIIKVNDVYFQNEPLRAIECGPLLFSIKYPENWNPTEGSPITPLPEGWSWYEASFFQQKDKTKSQLYYYSLDLSELNGGEAIIKKQSKSEYPWSDSPLKLEIPVHQSGNAYPGRIPWLRQRSTPMAYGNPVTADTETEIIELVPYGCTNLRQTCFTVCK